MTKIIKPGMMFIDKVHRAIDVVIFVDLHTVHFLNFKITKQITITYIKETKDNFQLLMDHFYDQIS